MMLAVVVFCVSVAYFATFAAYDDSLGKSSQMYLDEARAIRGDFALNERKTPSYHPLYPVVVALVHTPVTGSWERTARSVSVLSSALLVVLLWAWLRHADSASAGWAVGVLLLTNAIFVSYSTQVMAEAIGLLFFTASVVCVWQVGTRASLYWSLAAGVFAGLFALARTEGVLHIGYFLVPLVALSWTASKSYRKVLVNLLICLAAAIVVLVPYMIHLYPYNQRVSLFPDTKYGGVQGQRLPEVLWREIESLPLGTEVVEDRFVGVRGIPSLVGKMKYAFREYGEAVYEMNRELLAEILGAFALVLIGVSLIPRSGSNESGARLLIFLIYSALFSLVACAFTIKAFDFDALERHLIYLLPPALALAAIGCRKLASLVAGAIPSARWRLPLSQRSVMFGATLSAVALVAAPGMYWHSRSLQEANSNRRVIREAAEYILSEATVTPPVIGSYDQTQSFEADGWYVPFRRAKQGSLLEYSRRYGVEFVSAMGWGSKPWRQGMAPFLTKESVPDAFEYLREFGDPAGFHVVIYRVVPARPGKPRPDDP